MGIFCTFSDMTVFYLRNQNSTAISFSENELRGQKKMFLDFNKQLFKTDFRKI